MTLIIAYVLGKYKSEKYLEWEMEVKSQREERMSHEA